MNINIYVQTKIHKGNEAGAIRIVEYHEGGNVKASNITLYTGKETHFFIYNLTLRALREAYMRKYQTQPIQFMFIQKSSVRALKRIPAWEQQNWPVSQYDSKELYERAAKQGFSQSNGIPLDKIPKNYANYALTDLQQIAKGIKLFTGGVTFVKCDKQDDNHIILNNYLKSVVKGIPATAEYKQKIANRTKMTFHLPKQLKAQFMASCKKYCGSTPKVLTHLMTKYVRTHPAQVAPRQKSNSDPKVTNVTSNVVLSLSHEINLAINKSTDMRDFAIKLDRYGIIAHLVRHSRTGQLLKHAHFTFLNKNGHRVSISSRKLGVAYTPTAIQSRLRQNANAVTMG